MKAIHEDLEYVNLKINDWSWFGSEIECYGTKLKVIKVIYNSTCVSKISRESIFYLNPVAAKSETTNYLLIEPYHRQQYNPM